MTEETPIGKTGLRSGQVAIVTIGLVGLLFFGGMELLKRQLHSAPAAPISSVVVLPAKVLGTADVNYLTDAVPGTLSILLAQVKGLEAKVPPGSLEVDHLQGDLKKIATAYHVSTVLTSVIAVDGTDLTLNLQLANPETHSVLWSNQYLGKRTNYNELLRQAADGAGHALQPGSTRVTSTAGLASNSDAELADREGEYYLTRFHSLHENADFDLAAAAFKRALQLDPSLANAAAGIGLLYTFKVDDGESIKTVLPDVEKWGNEALRISPRNGRGYNLLGKVADYRGDHLDAVGYGLKAASAAPMDPLAQSALGSVVFASESLFLAVTRESRRLNPLSLYPQLNEALLLSHSGQMKEAFALVDDALRTDPEMPAALATRFQIDLLAGPSPDAADLSKKLGSLTPGRLPQAKVRFLRELYALEIDSNPEHALDQMDLSQGRAGPAALVLLQIGKTQSALDVLARESASGFNQPYDFLMLSPILAPIRNNPKFQPVLARSRAKFEELVAVLEDARAHAQLPGYLEKALDELLTKLGMRKTQ